MNSCGKKVWTSFLKNDEHILKWRMRFKKGVITGVKVCSFIEKNLLGLPHTVGISCWLDQRLIQRECFYKVPGKLTTARRRYSYIHRKVLQPTTHSHSCLNKHTLREESLLLSLDEPKRSLFLKLKANQNCADTLGSLRISFRGGGSWTQGCETLT